MTTNHVGSATASALAKRVEEIWNEVLDVPATNADATFFELRGESISAVRLVSRIEDELGIWVEVADIFEDDPNLETFVRQVVAKAESPAA
jgi:peptidyl carrier protein